MEKTGIARVRELEIEGIFDENWAEVEGNQARIYGQNFSARGREYGRKLVKIVTREEAETLAAALVDKQEKAKANRLANEAKKISRAEAWQNWPGNIPALPLPRMVR
jgi:hypothetical protein